MNKPPVAVLLSGGMDSTTALAHALTDADPARSLGIFVDYGQRHIVERDAARQVADWYGVNLVTLDLTGYGASVSSALTDPRVQVPHGHYADDNMAITVVPNRNATMLSAAAGLCAKQGIRHLYTAVHAGNTPSTRTAAPTSSRPCHGPQFSPAALRSWPPSYTWTRPRSPATAQAGGCLTPSRGPATRVVSNIAGSAAPASNGTRRSVTQDWMTRPATQGAASDAPRLRHHDLR